MAYVIAGLLSAFILGGTVLLGYRLFNWAFATNDTFAVLGIYIGVGIAVLTLAFVNGLIGYVLADIKGNSSFGIVMGVLWAAVFVALAIYPWFKAPYTPGLIIVRVLGSFYSLGSALWTFIMVALMSTKQ